MVTTVGTSAAFPAPGLIRRPTSPASQKNVWVRHAGNSARSARTVWVGNIALACRTPHTEKSSLTASRPSLIGPILILDVIGDVALTLSALFITEGDERPPPVETPGGAHGASVLARFDRATVWRARFDLPADRSSEYRWNGETYPVACNLRGDLRIAFVSCNGEEVGYLEREGSERNAMWARLGEAPLAQHPIRTEQLPGQRARYVAERNYLMLERQSDRWSAAWDLEESGLTPNLAL